MEKRNTIQRSLVLNAVNKLQCHATADEVYDEIAKEHPNISKATVYRNLKLLSDMGVIRRMEVPGGADRFDHRCQEHCHVRCENAVGFLMWIWNMFPDWNRRSAMLTDFNLPVTTSFFGVFVRSVRRSLPVPDKACFIVHMGLYPVEYIIKNERKRNYEKYNNLGSSVWYFPAMKFRKPHGKC